MELIPKISQFLWNMSCEKCDNHGIYPLRAPIPRGEGSSLCSEKSKQIYHKSQQFFSYLICSEYLMICMDFCLLAGTRVSLSNDK